MFDVLTDKAKRVEEVKHIELERKDRERAQSKVKKDSGPSGLVQRTKKRAKSDGPPRNEASVASNVISRCADYRRHHPGECCRKFEACLHYGSIEH